jgi:hypothetical protein
MNRPWLVLIIVGIVILIATIAFQFYQVSSGAESKINQIIIPMPRSNLITKNLETHLLSDPNFSSGQ